MYFIPRMNANDTLPLMWACGTRAELNAYLMRFYLVTTAGSAESYWQRYI